MAVAAYMSSADQALPGCLAGGPLVVNNYPDYSCNKLLPTFPVKVDSFPARVYFALFDFV
jgi:hypothetical protein